MKKPSIALLLVIALSPNLAAQKSASIDIEGEYTLLVTKLPITLTAKPGAAYYDWEITGKNLVEKTESLNKMTIKEAKNGDYEVLLRALVVDFKNEKTEVLESTIRFRIDTGGGKPVEPDPDDPDDFGAVTKLTKNLASDVTDKRALKAIASAYEKAFKSIAESKTINDAKKTVEKTVGDALQALPSLEFDLNVMFKEIAEEFKKQGGFDSAKNYIAGIGAIAKGLKEASE